MKVIDKKTIQKLAVFGLISLTTVLGLFALIKETTWGDSLSSGVRESIENDVYTPGRYAFDGDGETYWALAPSKVQGFAERYFYEETDIEGITAELYLPKDTKLFILWEKDGVLIPYENGIIKGETEGNVNISFPEEIRKTKHILFSLEGEDAYEAKIYEIQINERQDCRQFRKIKPVNYTFNQDEYINIKPSRLWDGIIGETWYEPLWYIPWEIQQTTEGKSGIFAPFYGHPQKEAEIIWELDAVYNIELLKAYFGAEYRSIAFEFWNGEHWTNRIIFNGNSQKGWTRKDIKETIKTDKVRITFPSGWEMARYINQIEIWGSGVPQNTERKVLFERDSKGSYRATLSAINEPFELRILTNKSADKTITVKINEDYYTATCFYTNKYRNIYCAKILSDSLRKETQFIEINSGSNLIESVTVCNSDDGGRILLGGHYTDNNIESPFTTVTEQDSKEFNLDRKYQLEKIIVYAENTDEIKIVNNKERGTYFYCNYKGNNRWEAELNGIEKNNLKIEGSYAFQINEIELYGSPVEDNVISIEYWGNEKNVTKDSCILGWIGNPETKVVADGNIYMRQADNLFWMPVRECNIDYLKKEKHTAAASLNGINTSRKFAVNAADDTSVYEETIKNSPLALSIELPYGKLITQNENIAISGCAGNGNNIRLFINGEEVQTEKDRYSKLLNLTEGNQFITVKAIDSTGRIAERTLEVIRDSTNPEIEILHPVMNQYINTGTANFYIDGKEEDLWWQFNNEKWERGYGRYKYKDYTLDDGFYTYSVRAQDRAGNISESKSVDFCMDKTPPESFKIYLNVSGWTNNNTPIAEFATTDKTSGVDYYEYRIDENTWKKCTSPLQLETLKDGKRNLQIRAIDKARNIREEKIEIDVDTTCPPLPVNARPVPDENSIFVKWIGADDNSISDDVLVEQEGGRSYRIERKPEWKDGIRFLSNYGYGKLQYEDTETKQGESYSYRVWSVDRAGNESEKTEWKSAITGLAVAEIEKEGDTYVEFEGLTITLPEGTTAEDIIRIQINEVPQTLLTDDDKPLNPLVGGIYCVTAVRKNGTKEIVTNHADLLKDAVLEIGYSKKLIPETYSDTDIALFYYDDLWGSWLRMKDFYIDNENQVIRCATNHFTEFSVQATKRAVLTEAELRESAYRLDSKDAGYGGINISGEDGGVSTRFTEFSLPGKNNLDFSVQRVYSTSKALEDSTDDNNVDIDGEKIWKIADGWRVNMPYMMWNGTSMVVYGTDGAVTSLSQMTVKGDPNDDDNKKVIMMESHEYSDLMTELKFRVSDHRFLFWTWETYKFDSAVLHQGDGKKVYFDDDGKVERITDCTGKSEISFGYDEKNKITVTDSYGRKVYFYIKNGMISKIQSGNREVNYTVEKKRIEFSEADKKNSSSKKKEAFELVSAKDVGSREWKYNYEINRLSSGSKLIETNHNSEKSETGHYYNVLKGITGPQAGYTELSYEIKKDITYIDEVKSYGTDYKYEISQDKITANSKSEWVSEKDYTDKKPCLRKTTVNVTFAEPIKKNIFVNKSVVSDGRTVVATEYGTVEKECNRISQALEALRKYSDYDLSVADAKDKVQILTYAKESKVYDGTVDDNNLIQTEVSEISETLMRITKKEVIKSEKNRTLETYDYDSLGNIIAEKHETQTDDATSGYEITRTFMPVINNRMNLPQSVKTVGYATDVASPSVTENELYEYNTYGQVTSKKMGDGAVTYYSYYDTDGQLEKIVSPEGNVTLYTYDNPEADSYKISVISKDVAGLQTVTDLTEYSIYDFNTGNLVKQQDKEGYLSLMQYDSLGRITNQKKYHSPNTQEGIYSEVKVIYDDAANTSTVTDELACVTINTFDGLGRLIKVERKGNTLEKASLKPVEKTITVLLDYDSYDRVIKMTEPSYGIPSLEESQFVGTVYEYDSQNRLTKQTDSDKNVIENIYEDKQNLTTQNIYQTVTANGGYALHLNEKSGVQKDNFGNVIKEIRYFTADGESKESEKSVTYVYDGKGRKLKVTDAKNNETCYKYNSRGLLSETDYPNGLVEINTYNKDGYLIETESKDGNTTLSKTNYKVNAFGNVYEQKLQTGTLIESKPVVITKEYDGRGNVLSEKTSYENDSSDIREKKWIYDWNGKVLSETDGEGNTTTYTYDNKGNVVSVTDPRQAVSSYKAEFQMKMEYDSFGRLVKGRLPQNVKRSDGAAADVYLVYDAQGNCIYRKDQENVETEYLYSNAGKLLSQTTDGYVTSYEYNGAGKTTKVTNPDSTWTQYDYDKAGNLLYEAVKGTPSAIKYTYDKNGNRKSVIDRKGNKTSYEYDSMNRVTSENAAELTQKTVTYDKLGHVISEEDGEKNKRSYEYDMLGRITKETVNDENSTELSYEYDTRGNVISFKDAKGIVFKRIYSKADKLLSETVVDNNSEKETWLYKYDEAGALKSVSDVSNTVYYNGAKSDYQPDAYGNTKREYWSKTGFAMDYGYDNLNRLISVTTPDGKSENYTYNKNSQVTAISGLLNGTLSYNNSRLEIVTLNDGLNKTLSYNEAGLISGISYISDKNTSVKTGFEYLYDKNFNITQRTHLDTGNKDTYEYDEVNHLVASKLQGKFYNDTYEQFDLFRMSEIDRDIDGLAYEKDENLQVLNGQFFPADKVTLDENGKSFVYDFTEEKEIQKIELFKNNLSIASRVRERDIHVYTKQNKEDGWSELSPDNWYYEVDTKNQSIHINLKNTLKTQFIKIRTIWDDRDIDNKNVSDYVTFSNDSVQKMIRIWTVNNTRDEDYTYDKNSNRTSLTKDGQTEEYLYYKNTSGGNTARVMYDGKWWYTYDANGNRIARASNAVHNNNKVTVDTNGEYWEYKWDYHNRLVKVQQFNASDNSTNVFVEYTYDALNRRIERISKTKAEQGITRYAYGRNGALTYQKKENENIKTTRTFSYLNDQIIGFIDSDSDGTKNIRYTVTDIQGTVTEVYDENNKLLWKSGYTAFGIKAGETTDLIDFDGLYTGCDYDVETGLTYHWNRWRSEDGNSWLSEDPARDGMNWYGYAGQNPITFLDPDGLIAETAWDIASLSLGIVSLSYNIYHGNTKEAIFDGIGILADAAAVALPFIPGGVGAARKAVKATKIAAEAAGGTEAVISGGKSVAEGIQNGDYLEAGLGALQAVAGAGQLGNAANQASSLIEKVETPYGVAKQSFSKASLNVRGNIESNGATLYRGGTTGISQAAEGQFWSLENPLTTPNFADKYGIPAENFEKMNFVETSTIKQGDLFITRPAPGIGNNIGGGIEVVIPSESLSIDSFSVVK